jgi:hypothetical protein
MNDDRALLNATRVVMAAVGAVLTRYADCTEGLTLERLEDPAWLSEVRGILAEMRQQAAYLDGYQVSEPWFQLAGNFSGLGVALRKMAAFSEAGFTAWDADAMRASKAWRQVAHTTVDLITATLAAIRSEK